MNDVVSSRRARFVALAMFFALVLMTGGGSRADILSLVILRPAAALFGAYALLVRKPGDLTTIKVPLILLSCLIGWMLVQLIPLPESWWSALPQRSLYAQIGELLGLGSLWRPITLSPFATLNSLLSLVVPFSALLLIAVQDRSKGASQRIVVLILVAALLSSMLGIMQMLGSYRNPFYLYRISNFDSPVGFFANRNHQSVFLAINVVACAFMFARGIELGARGNILKIFALISAILLAAMVFINGSRAGLIVLALAMMISLAVIPLNAGVRGKKGKLATLQKLRSNRYLLVALPVILLGALLIGRKTVVVDRLIQSDIAEDLRGQTFSQVVDMAIAYLPLGTGFGSFEYVYRAHEKLQLLIPAYLNEAHNDLLQIVVEGGLPAVAILLAGVSWLVFTGTNLLKKGSGERRGLYIFCLSVCGFVALASAVDYPVRTPIFMTVLAMVIAMLSEARHRLELAGTPGVK